MSARLVKLLVVAVLITAAVCYLFYLNPEAVTLHWGSGSEQIISGPLALVLVVAFFIGVFTAAVFAFLIGVRYQLRDWKQSRLERLRESHAQLLVQAREQLAAENFAAARGLLQKIIDKDPADIVARIQLAEVEKRQGQVDEALRILDQARAGQKKNLELLFFAAELQEQQGNRTAAADNLRLVLAKDQRNSKALEALVLHCRALGQFSQAEDYQQQLIRLARTNAEQANRLEHLAELELESALYSRTEDPAEFRDKLERLLQRHRDFVPALYELGCLEQEALNLDKANKLFSKAYKLSPQPRFLEAIAKLWLGVDEPARALANVRNLIQSAELTREQALDGRVFFICLLLYLENIDEAVREREKLRSENSDSRRYQAELAVVDALLLKRNAGIEEAFDVVLDSLLAKEEFSDLRVLAARESVFDEHYRQWAAGARKSRRLAQDTAPRLLTTS
jgi:tetratricopeptide (TPR) repeat protein